MPKAITTHPIVLWGKVRPGFGRGRSLGFPTANLRLHKAVTDGIYAAETKVDGRWYPSATFVGAAKTYGATERLVETTLLGYRGKLYGQWITVRLHKKLRPNRRFASGAALKRAMQNDLQQVRKFFHP